MSPLRNKELEEKLMQLEASGFGFRRGQIDIKNLDYYYDGLMMGLKLEEISELISDCGDSLYIFNVVSKRIILERNKE